MFVGEAPGGDDVPVVSPLTDSSAEVCWDDDERAD